MSDHIKNVCSATGKETFEIVRVTPEIAKAFLEYNTKNRSPRKTVIDFYAGAMLRGEWEMTGEPIAFDTDGVLANGQHRLYAVIKANVSVDFLVVRNVKPAAKIAFDSHAKRSQADQVNLVGAKRGPIKGNLPSSVLKLLIDPKKANSTSSQMLTAWDGRLGEATQWATSGHFKKQKGVTVAPVFAAIASAYFYVQDLERLERFKEVLICGDRIGLSEEESAAWKLGDYLAEHMADLTDHDARFKKLSMTQKAIGKFIRREEVKQQRVPPRPELIYSIPITGAAVR